MGRRWGKTFLGGDVSLAAAAVGGQVAWIVPIYKNGRSLWRWAVQAVAPLLKNKLVVVNKTERTIDFPSSGGSFGIYSADNEDAIRGEKFHLVVLDEAARISETAWTDAIQPTLADYDGDAILISTPRGRNWFWNEYQRGLGDGIYQRSWTAPSSANPSENIKAAAARARGKVTEFTYRQEWLAEFVDSEGMVFRRVQEAATSQAIDKPEAGRQYVAGVDVAASVDFTVITVMDVADKRMIHQDRFNRVDYNVLEDRLETTYRAFNLQSMTVESNSIGQPVIDHLYKKGLTIIPFTTASATKQVIIQNLQSAFEHGEIKIINDPVTIGELLSFESKRNQAGGFSYGAPDGMHDDTVMSLAIAWNAITDGGWLAM